MGLSLTSPRFSLRTVEIGEVEQALQEIGHVVLDDVWRLSYLEHLHSCAERAYELLADRLAEAADPTVVRVFSRLRGSEEEEFLLELERSGLLAVLRALVGGDVVINQGHHVVRRQDPALRGGMTFQIPHTDTQLSGSGVHGRTLTVWTPLVDCTDDRRSRLLLLHRRETTEGLFWEQERAGYLYATNPLERERERVEAEYSRIYADRQCYAPPVKLGSIVLFEAHVFHGTYFSADMDQVRYSMDFRLSGTYTPSPKLSPEQISEYLSGVIWRRGAYVGEGVPDAGSHPKPSP